MKTGLEQLKECIELEYNKCHSTETNKVVKMFLDKARSLLSAEREAKPIAEPAINGNTSDGYHTFNELYDHRVALYLDIVAQNSEWFWKSKKHEDGSEFAGWFILGGNMGTGDISYHLPLDKWDMAKCKEITLGKKWDGHTAKDVVERILRHSQAPNTSRPSPKPTTYEEWRSTLSPEEQVESDKELARLVKEHEANDMAGLREALEKLARLGNGSEYGNSDGNRIAQEALAKYTSTPIEPKPTGDALKEIEKRIEKLMEGMNRDDNAYRFGLAVLDEVEAIRRELAHTPSPLSVKPTESLAELADKFFYGVSYGHNPSEDEPFRITLIMGFDGKKKFHGPTYAAAENAAREYLMGLPDKTREDGRMEK